MTGNIVIFVTDQRQSNLAACLPGKIHRLDWRRGVEKEEALEVLDNSRYLVLPVPVTKIERNHDVNLILKEELTGKKERDWILFGGVFGPEWRQRCEDAGTEYYDMMTDAVVVHRNACITAEATVAEILKYSDYPGAENYCQWVWKMRQGDRQGFVCDGSKSDSAGKERRGTPAGTDRRT